MVGALGIGLLLTTTVCTKAPDAVLFPYTDVVIFVDADRAPRSTIIRRLELVRQVGEFYNRRPFYDRFHLRILGIGEANPSGATLFDATRTGYNSQGTFNPPAFVNRYSQVAAATHNRDLVGTLAILATMVRNQPESRFLVIYISNMIHVTPRLDTSQLGRGQLGFEDFKRDYRSLLPPRGAFREGGARVDVLIHIVGESAAADAELPQFWASTIFRDHLGANPRFAAGTTLIDLLTRAH